MVVWKVRLLRKEINTLISILLFSSIFLILFALPEDLVEVYSFEQYLIGLFIIFLISLFVLKIKGAKIWIFTLLLFFLFSLIRTDVRVAAPMIFFIVFPFYWYKYKKESYKKTINDLGLKLKEKKYIILYGFVGFCFIILAVALIGAVFYVFDLNDQENVKERIKELPLIAIPLAIFVAPFAEEFFFRGFLLKKLGVWASAFIFAIMHFTYGSIVEITAAFAIALLLSFLFIKTESLYPSIIAHGLFNILSLSIMWLL